MFHHGWPLSSDDWDAQLLFLVRRGYRVVAHDRRGHGRSAQAGHGHDMDRYAAKAARVAPWSRGWRRGRPVITGHIAGRVAKAVLIAAVPPRGHRPLPVQPSVRGRLPEHHPELVAPGDGRQRAGASRGDQSVRGDGLHRRPLGVPIG
ncbi:alpha/beta fold hydrolase [Streptomyces albogriseolus]|uniref:alpha/beta fold hydrolase n=1 Tax=Streptomyces TaxID=1883 RepID=UPI0036AFBA15